MKIVTIGGGEINREETIKIDRFICELTNKPNPNALFIPTASGDAVGYCENFFDLYAKKLGCQVDYLLATQPDFSTIKAQEKIAQADLIYVGGGNTLKLLEIWGAYGIFSLIHQAAMKGTVLSGLSAGAICWYEYGLSDYEKFSGKEHWKFRGVPAAGWLAGQFCPHLNAEKRHEALIENMFECGTTTIACDNGAAVYWNGSQAQVLTNGPNANAYIYTRKETTITIEKFANGARF